MLSSWEAEKENLVRNYRKLRVQDLKKRLRREWTLVNKPELQIISINKMQKKEVVKHLFDLFEINMIIERQNKKLLGR